MPMKPASDEQAAPEMTAIAECIPRAIQTKTTKTAMKTSKYLYSVFINANAPLWI